MNAHQKGSSRRVCSSGAPRPELFGAWESGRQFILLWHSKCFRFGVTNNSQSDSKSVSTQLLADHRLLEEQYLILLEAARAGDLPTLSAIWTEFERHLDAHMEGEERFVLAPLEPKHQEMVRKIRQEHQAIRDLIAAIGVSTDLHAVRLKSLEDLGLLLRDHASQEDRTIYQFAARELDCSPILRFLRSQTILLN